MEYPKYIKVRRRQSGDYWYDRKMNGAYVSVEDMTLLSFESWEKPLDIIMEKITEKEYLEYYLKLGILDYE